MEERMMPVTWDYFYLHPMEESCLDTVELFLGLNMFDK